MFVQHPTNHKGNIAELAIAARAAEFGIGVLKPLTEHERYDLVFDLGHRLLRVQCKWGSLRDEVIHVRLSRSRHTPRGYVVRKYDADEVDAFGVYCGELDRCYLIPVSCVPDQYYVYLRVGPTMNAQKAAINWASKYQLPGAVAQWEERSDGIRQVGGSSPPSSTSVTTEGRPVSVGAHDFRNRFGWYMERARAGEEFLVTRRSKPYVRLVSAESPLPTSD